MKTKILTISMLALSCALVSQNSFAAPDDAQQNGTPPQDSAPLQPISRSQAPVAPAHTVQFSLVAGMNLTAWTQTSQAQANNQAVGFSQSAGLGYTFGFLLGFNPLANFELETGLEFSHHKINFSDSFQSFSGTFNATYNTLEIPVVARYDLLPFLGLGGGFYYARQVGPYSLNNSTIPGLSNGSIAVNDANSTPNDFGLIFNARVSAPLAGGMAVFFDARYLLGLTNINNDGNSVDNFSTREIQLLAGLGFGF